MGGLLTSVHNLSGIERLPNTYCTPFYKLLSAGVTAVTKTILHRLLLHFHATILIHA